jgi:hypothetical protein
MHTLLFQGFQMLNRGIEQLKVGIGHRGQLNIEGGKSTEKLFPTA